MRHDDVLEPFSLQQHPLDGVRQRTIFLWPQWLERWQMPDLTHQERLGLVRTGFEMLTADRSDSIERTIFYLRLADGYAERRSAYEGASGERSASDFRELVSRELVMSLAMEMLIRHFFVPSARLNSEKTVPWRDFISNDDGLDQLLYFFRPRSDYDGLVNLPYLGPSLEPQDQKQVRTYLARVIDYLLCLRNFEFEYHYGQLLIKRGETEAKVVSILAGQGKRIHEIITVASHVRLISCLNPSNPA